MPTAPTADWRKLPPEMSHALLRRGEWSLCAMEHSRVGAVEFDAPGAPFHHLALPLERAPLRFGLRMDGRRQDGRNAPDTLTMIEAGAGGTTMWDGTFESACFYFTTGALAAALGLEDGEAAHDVRTKIGVHAPVLVRLLHALHADAAAGQPHGTLVGDAIFVALAAELVPRGEHRRQAARTVAEPWRVRRALEHIHARLTEPLDIAAIAAAAATSPFYLNHAFRAALGCSIWQYVLRERARHAAVLMRDSRLNLAGVSQLAGFDTYAGFIAATRRTYGKTPARLRRELGHELRG
ncbi:MAG: AraC family transcriptional regulator [Sphingomonas bacterium]